MTIEHHSTFAGMWYPGRPDELDKLIERLFAQSRQRCGAMTPARARAYVVPHAGLEYSGTVASAVYRALKAAPPQRIFVLGFLHSGGWEGITSPAVDAYVTPSGKITVDRATASALGVEREAFDHSIEIQLPLLRASVPDVPIVPLYAGRMSVDERSRAATALAGRLEPGDVLLVSTDLTHYGPSFGYLPFPHDRSTRGELRALDDELIEAISSLDARLFIGTLRARRATLCGVEPVALALETLAQLGGEELFAECLDAQHSGEITGDFRNSVGYGAIAIRPESAFYPAPEALRALLESACDTVRNLRETGEEHRIETMAQGTERRAGVFVSLHAGGELLGCLGRLDRTAPLGRSVPELALDAALRDPRFEHDRPLPERIEVEVSVLTPFKRIADESRFRLGEHGALLDYAGRRALLLPQVAREHSCTAEWFLEALSRKAGLAPGAYHNADARLSVFRARISSSFDTMEVETP